MMPIADYRNNRRVSSDAILLLSVCLTELTGKTFDIGGIDDGTEAHFEAGFVDLSALLSAGAFVCADICASSF